MTGGSRPCTGRPTWRTTMGKEKERGRGGYTGTRAQGCLLPFSHAPSLSLPPSSYLEIYEYLLSRGADPIIRTKDYDPYLDPGRKTPAEVAVPDPAIRAALDALEAKYAGTPKARRPHPDIGCWWTLYDYGVDVVKGWAADYVHPYPGEREERERWETKRALPRSLNPSPFHSVPSHFFSNSRPAEEGRRAKDKAARRAKRDSRAAAAGAGVTVAGAATSTATVTPAAPVLPLLPPHPPVPDTPVAFLFPGQGAQTVGMLAAVAHLPAVQAMLADARDVLGYDLLAKCVAGPAAALDATEVAQPALFIAGLAAVERLRAERGEAAVAACSAAAGLSLGEYAALVFAGALSFRDGLRIVAARGAAMAAAARAGGRPHGMLSIIGLDDAEVEAAAAAGRAAGGPGTVCAVANRLFPTGRVLGGHSDALDAAAAAASAAGALKAAHLAVAGAFHTPLMAPARAALEAALAGAAFRAPRMPVLSNVTAAPFPGCPGPGGAPGDDAAAAAGIPALLARQLVEPVRWEETLAALVHDWRKDRLVEVGPGGQIKAMVKRVDGGAWKAMECVGV
jgi:[acyl-carrier-protein] S-malonyltransferase